MPVLTWPQPLPLCSPSLRIRLKRKKPSRACPKTVGCGRGGQGSCAQHSWSSSVPGRAPPAPTQARLPAKVQACPQVSHLLGAAGMAQGLQDTGQLCPAHLQKVVSAQWVGFKEAHEPVPVGNSTVPSETLDINLSFGSHSPGLGKVAQLCPSPCQSCTGQGERGSAGQGPVLSRDPGSTWSCHTLT